MQDLSSFNLALFEEIQQQAQIVHQQYPQAIILPQILEVIKHMPRHLFVTHASLHDAYLNVPLSIGYKQTISQPYIVALMTSLLEPKANEVVLEIGTGSGYQAAILAKLVHTVYTVEIIPELSQRAQDTFNKLQLANLRAKVGNGFYGYKAAAPYDKIIVTAAVSKIPPELIKQLKSGGKLVIPLQEAKGEQNLWLVTKTTGFDYIREKILPVKFVPFVHDN